MFTALVRVTGAGRLADFRERLRWLLVRDPDAEDYSEHHAEGQLEYRFTPKKGIPFPALAEASGDFPEVADDARLALAMVCERHGETWIGYAASAERHTYFRYREGELTLISPTDADAELEDIAFRLVDEWLWYDEEEAPAERARYAQYGHTVRGANLKSEKLSLLRRASGAYSTLGSEAEPLRAALLSQWLNPT
ncbi:MAG: hypothetical protein E6H77_09740 [Betaproteobacteria bacterium]|nr:MAG: hypothetical protein E6H77_09740 [Betaproteobacteria bacterium]